jgi:hypothetical protein
MRISRKTLLRGSLRLNDLVRVNQLRSSRGFETLFVRQNSPSQNWLPGKINREVPDPVPLSKHSTSSVIDGVETIRPLLW